jgi:DNA polymerase-3 subunit gamma/tau
LATTEKHKIIPTILSRCQTFDFKRIQLKDVAKHLAYISTEEGIEADMEALHIIAEKADGSMRDALSIFDQMVSFAGKQLTYKKVIDNLNILDYDYYFKVTEHILNSDVASTLLVFDEILANGFDGHLFVGGLSEHFRNLVVAKNPATAALLEKGGQLNEKYIAQGAQYPESFLFTGLTILNQCDVNYKMAVNQRLLVEITLMKLCNLSSIQSGTPVATNTIIKETPTKPAKATAAPTAAPIQAKAAPVPAPKEPEPKAEVKTTPPPTVARKPSMPSVSKMLGEDLNAKAKVQTGPEKIEPITHLSNEAIQGAWKEYVEANKEKKISLGRVLALFMPAKSATDTSAIEITVGNSVQQQSIEEDRQNLLDFLRGKLKAPQLKLIINVSKTETQTRPYTSQEKFLHMKEKNPEVEKLKNQFDLGIE